MITSVFEMKDKTCRIIRLTKKQWGHICDHKEMVNQIGRIKETLIRPDKLITSPKDVNACYYFRHYKETPFPAKFLLVAVKYLNGDGFVITAFYTTQMRI